MIWSWDFFSSAVCRWRNDGLSPRFSSSSQLPSPDLTLVGCPHVRLESLKLIPSELMTAETEAAVILCELDRISDHYSPPHLPAAESDALDKVEVRAAGQEDAGGAGSKLLLRGQSCGVLGRGFNIAVLNEQLGVTDNRVMSFDTVDSDNASERMADFLEGVSEGRIVLVATSESASEKLSARAVAALRSIGADKLDKLESRGALALIGRKGSTPGSVPQAISERRKGPVSVSQQLPAPKVPLAVEVNRWTLNM